jgi:hypothetical protein
MKSWARIMICSLIGIIAGSGYAMSQVRGGFADGTISNGPWTSGKSFGSADASALTRAKVALSGLLALPAKEAMYFTASVDSEGRPLEGRCTYLVEAPAFAAGGAIEARWWSITLYDPAGYLVANPENRYSTGSGNIGAVTLTPNSKWGFRIGPNLPKDPGNWVSTGGIQRFDLTLRTYHPGAKLLQSPETATLPSIIRERCL